MLLPTKELRVADVNFQEGVAIGQFKMSTKPGNMQEVIKAYETQTKTNNVKVVKSILSPAKYNHLIHNLFTYYPRPFQHKGRDFSS